MARDLPVASDLSYFVIQKLHRERQLLSGQANQAHQHAQSVRGTKAEILTDGESAEAETSLWVRHGS